DRHRGVSPPERQSTDARAARQYIRGPARRTGGSGSDSRPAQGRFPFHGAAPRSDGLGQLANAGAPGLPLLSRCRTQALDGVVMKIAKTYPLVALWIFGLGGLVLAVSFWAVGARAQNPAPAQA